MTQLNRSPFQTKLMFKCYRHYQYPVAKVDYVPGGLFYVPESIIKVTSTRSGVSSGESFVCVSLELKP